MAFVLFLAGPVRAAGPDDQYLEIYTEILQADNSLQNGDSKDAATQYLQVQSALQKFKAEHADWNPEVIDFRLEYTGQQLQKLAKFLPAANAPQSPAAAPSAGPVASPEQQAAELRRQVDALTAANNDLENRLKEALSVQPAAVSPVELAKAQERIVALEKERDLLKIDLEQAKATVSPAPTAPPPESPAVAELAETKLALADAQAKLKAAAAELDALKTAPVAAPAADGIRPLTEERDKLKEELALRTKDLADAEANHDQDLFDLRDALKKAQQQRDDLQKKLDAAAAAPPAAAVAPAPAANENPAQSQEVEQLQARLAVLEAQAVPYTAQELALLKQSQTPAASLPAPAEHKHVVHSSKDLPPGAGPLMADAMRAVMERDFAGAEQKCQEILRQDENNVYVLAYLANAQLAQGHVDECDKTVQRALAADPEDPASLYLLGVVRFQQAKYDEALDALSHSAKLNPTNASTENYLGCVLAEKGQRAAAETALRKSLEVNPDYADAHYNLAFIYATEKPPSPELALWHYQRALTLGHPKNPELEKLLPAN